MLIENTNTNTNMNMDINSIFFNIPMDIIDNMLKIGIDIGEPERSRDIDDAIDSVFNIIRQEIKDDYKKWKEGK